MNSMSVPIGDHFHAKQDNSGKIMFLDVVPLLLPLIRGDPHGMKFCHKILETLNYRMVKTRSLCHLSLDWYLDMPPAQMNGQIDRQKILP